jgi:hypothetical protein
MAFNEQAYLAANPDVAASGMSGAQHYQMFGQYEGRDPGGATSGAQQHYWDNQAWQQAPGNAGGTMATGVLPGTAPMPNLAGAPGNASYYLTPYQFGGQTGLGGLDDYSYKQLQQRVAAGEDYNQTALRLLGDGIGTTVPRFEPGFSPYGYDLGSGQWVDRAGVGGKPSGASATTYGPNVNLGAGSGAITSPSGAVTNGPISSLFAPTSSMTSGQSSGTAPGLGGLNNRVVR